MELLREPSGEDGRGFSCIENQREGQLRQVPTCKGGEVDQCGEPLIGND